MSPQSGLLNNSLSTKSILSPHDLTSRTLGIYPSKAGLLTILHSEVPSHPSGQWPIASKLYGSSQLRDSRRLTLHSQLIAAKRTSAGRINDSTGQRYEQFLKLPNF